MELVFLKKIDTFFFPARYAGKFPAPSTIHHFVKYRLGERGLDFLMMRVSQEMTKSLGQDALIVDSTPLPASRYSKVSVYNPHYKTISIDSITETIRSI